MDWPLTGALTGVTALTGFMAYAAVSFIWHDAKPMRKIAPLAPLSASVERPTYAVAALPNEPSVASHTLILMGDPVTPMKNFETPPIEVFRKPPSSPDRRKTVSLGPTRTWNPSSQDSPIAIERWKVTPTSKANAFNLGGHIDKAGIVSSVASGHLREAFKKHKNFAKLPPHLRIHIETQNINLSKVAPYRGLLGIDDRRIEDEQGVRFERIVSSQ